MAAAQEEHVVIEDADYQLVEIEVTVGPVETRRRWVHNHRLGHTAGFGGSGGQPCPALASGSVSTLGVSALDGLVWRLVGGRCLVSSVYKEYGPWAIISATAVVVVAGLGAWWTAVAAYDGDVGSMLVRFGLSVVGGTYYVVLHRLATGRRLEFRGFSTDR